MKEIKNGIRHINLATFNYSRDTSSSKIELNYCLACNPNHLYLESDLTTESVERLNDELWELSDKGEFRKAVNSLEKYLTETERTEILTKIVELEL